MSELQISLIAIGLIVVMGVVFFNWIQQWRFRRGAEEAFGRKHEDVLLRTDTSVVEGGRVEPQLGKEVLQDFQVEPQVEPAEAMEIVQSDLDSPTFDAMPPAPATSVEQASNVSEGVIDAVDYVVSINGETLIADSHLTEVLQRKFDFNKPVRWLGQRDAAAFWEEITMETSGKGGYVNVKGCLQLADRAGPLSEVTLSEFRDMMQNFAANVNAAADCPDVREAYARALSIDQFCAKVDVMIGINIISKDASPFTGAKIRVLAETSGFKLGPEGAFHYRDESNAVLFSLNNHEPPPFLSDSIRTLTTHGITFLLDVPRVANGEQVFDQMMHLAGIFSDALGGIMVDDNRVLLSDSGIGKIKQQLIAIQSVMLARNIPAGGEIALRLFA
ncbi:cell division protein ZipA C-terminal FtsZ-binding domain-containing protein [Nitrosospira sp. Nl5]|uniref:cell division protein ZipA C-terminal FtsZ-binding domain-containing protein n=1 Tax=Nitrosospira sp. Nl5 TaxID=200120 RepID=UPI0035246036